MRWWGLLGGVCGICLAVAALWAQTDVVVEGRVVDAQTGEPVAGASVVALRGQRGSYSSARGFFRLLLQQPEDTLLVRSLGYAEARVPIGFPGAALEIRLQPLSLELAPVRVTAELSAEEIIHNAQLRRQLNWQRVQTAEVLLYSKLVVAVGGQGVSLWGQRAAEEDSSFAILETFSRYYYDAQRGQRAVILQRRQTRNVPPQVNTLVFGALGSLYQERVDFFTVSIPSPIGPEALERYRFRVRERKLWGRERLVYVLELEPRGRLYPAFEGEIGIVDSTFALVYADVRPSGSTALPFLRQVRFLQRCEPIGQEIWFPTFAEVSGVFDAVALQGVLQLGGWFKLSRIATEVRCNEPLPDSLFAVRQPVQVAPFADSVRAEFWQRSALTELSPQEVEIYRRMDSVGQRTGESGQGWLSELFSLPFGRFTRVTGVQLGVAPRIRFGGVEASGVLAYAFARSVWEGWGQLAVGLGRTPLRFAVRGFAWTGPMGWERTYAEAVTSVVAAVLGQDYYDWVYREGGAVEGQVALPWASAVGIVRLEGFRLVGLPVRVERSLFGRTAFRANPVAAEGRYRVGVVAFRWGDGAEGLSLRFPPPGVHTDGAVEAVAGRWQDSTGGWRSFWGAVLRMQLELPTFSTGGYLPMKLRVWAEVGEGREVPLPYVFRLRTTAGFLGRLGHLVTAPTGVYGGRRLWSIALEHGFSDLWWRALGLPTVRGRGPELSLTAAAAQTLRAEGTPYRATGKALYAELGVGIGRLPLLVTELFTGRVDICAGVGPLARHRWGAAFTVMLGL